MMMMLLLMRPGVSSLALADAGLSVSVSERALAQPGIPSKLV